MIVGQLKLIKKFMNDNDNIYVVKKVYADGTCTLWCRYEAGKFFTENSRCNVVREAFMMRWVKEDLADPSDKTHNDATLAAAKCIFL